MKNILIVSLIILLAIFIWMWADQRKNTDAMHSQLLSLQDSLANIDHMLMASNENYDVLKREKDSLFNALQTKSANQSDPETQYTAEEKQIHQLIFKVHNGWEDLFKDKDSDKFLSLFMPKFTTNEVTIDTKNLPHVERHNDRDFAEHIVALANTADLRIEFGNTRFLATFIRDNIFTTTYQTRLEVKDKYKTVQASNIICYVSGEKSDGSWKVGNYNWTRYNFMEYQ